MLQVATIMAALGAAAVASADGTDALQNVYGRAGTTLNGEWRVIVDPYENGYYNEKKQAFYVLQDFYTRIAQREEGAATGNDAIDTAATLALMEKVADWQLAHLEPVASIRVAREETRSPRSWQQGAFYAGLTALAQRSASPRFRDAVFAQGRGTGWQLGD